MFLRWSLTMLLKLVLCIWTQAIPLPSASLVAEIIGACYRAWLWKAVSGCFQFEVYSALYLWAPPLWIQPATH